MEASAPQAEARLLDVQFLTPHLERLGACEISRGEYLARLQRALPCESIDWEVAARASDGD